MPEAPFIRWVWEWTKSIVVALLLWFVVRTFLVEAFTIPSGSMERTLLVGDFLFVNKALYGAEVPLIHRTLPAFREPERGDILVFDGVEDPEMKLVKRLIGIPGDTLAMRDGQLYRNGRAVAEPYALHEWPTRSADPLQRERMHEWQVHYLAGGDTARYEPDLHDWGPIVVPADSFFMMGDNRDDSYDSRYWGFVPRQSIRGRPLLVYFSVDADRGGHGLPFLAGVRWGRLFTTPN